MMRVPLDTNVLLVIIPKYSKYAKVYSELKKRNPKFNLILSDEILWEYEEQMKFRYGDLFVEDELNELLFLKYVEKVNPWFKWQLINNDPDDNKFVDCAVAANADYIVTNDKHFNVVKNIPFPKMRIVTLQGFINILGI